MRKKLWTALYIFMAVVVYLVGAVSSLMYENGLAWNVAWNWVMKGSSQVMGFIFLAAILSFLYFSILYYAFSDGQLLVLAVMTVLSFASYFIGHYLYFALLGAVGLASLIVALYLEKRQKVPGSKGEEPIEENADQLMPTEGESEEPESSEASLPEDQGANLDELDERELEAKINALFNQSDDFDHDTFEETYLDESDEQDLDFAEDEVTINDLTGEFAALQEDEKNKSEDLS